MFIQSYCSLSSTHHKSFCTSVILLMISLGWITRPKGPWLWFCWKVISVFVISPWNETSYIYKGRKKLLLRTQDNPHFVWTPSEVVWCDRWSFARACSGRSSTAYWDSTNKVVQERFLFSAWNFLFSDKKFDLSSFIFCMSYDKCFVLLRFWSKE